MQIPLRVCFHIRKSPDQRLFTSFPELIAGFHVLHRLSIPRHPPYTLKSLTIIIDHRHNRAGYNSCSSKNLSVITWHDRQKRCSTTPAPDRKTNVPRGGDTEISKGRHQIRSCAAYKRPGPMNLIRTSRIHLSKSICTADRHCCLPDAPLECGRESRVSAAFFLKFERKSPSDDSTHRNLQTCRAAGFHRKPL
jgi:hypothetical protein